MKESPWTEGDRVITTKALGMGRDWTREQQRTRRWGIPGTVLREFLGGDGPCYTVLHDDTQTEGWYYFWELEPELGSRLVAAGYFMPGDVVQTIRVQDPLIYTQECERNRIFGAEGVVVETRNVHSPQAVFVRVEDVVGVYERRELRRISPSFNPLW